MPERPLLKLPEPEVIDPRPGPRGGGTVVRPTRDRQRERIDPRFEQLSRVAQDPVAILALRDDPASIAPERAIVFEVEGSLKDFYEQARDIGLEYLGDFEEELNPSPDFHDTDEPDRKLAGRIYLAMPDQRSLRELLSLWDRFRNNNRMPRGKGAWTDLFKRLVDVRPWGPQDRIPDETIRAWRGDLAAAPDQPVKVEIELWYHEGEARRAAALNRVSEHVAAAGGRVIDHAVIGEIAFDGMLTEVPAAHVQQLIEHRDVNLALADEVMFLRPQSMARHPGRVEFEGADGPEAAPVDMVAPEPIAALLDGLPIQNHARLAGRLRVDDPEGMEPAYPVAQRKHGTEMASLIIHGDLNLGEASIRRPLYVRPVFRPTAGGERTPENRLLVDVIYQAVRRMKEGDGDQPATAPRVALVNLSLGDERRPFARVMSPLGRLLDYLAHRYGILFLVSAGNIRDGLVVQGFQTSIEFEAATPAAREQAILSALNANKSQRTLISPAEALNVLTIGAAHQGSAFTGTLPANLIDPFTDEELPNIVSAMGLGYKRSVKPELLFAGGRAPVRVWASGTELTIRPTSGSPSRFGLKAASPSRLGGDRHEDFTWGTSVATALATRSAHRIYEALFDDANSNHPNVEAPFVPIVLKALLVHGAEWGPKGAFLDQLFGPHGQGAHFARRDDICRLLGFGVPRIERVLDCAVNRATLVGYGRIAPDSAVLYRVPLPAGLDGVRAFRAVTISLAWFSPINRRHQGYRMAALDVSSASPDKYWIAPERPCQPTDKAIARGTVFHERRAAEAATVFVDNGFLHLRVSCRSSAGTLIEHVPYALVVSFEVGIDAGIQVYEQVQQRLAAQVRAAARA